GRVGELDEEMVYEARAGQVIMLGASSWRIEEITRDRVLVSPAPGVPGAGPVWEGGGGGGPGEAGRAVGGGLGQCVFKAGTDQTDPSDRARSVQVCSREFVNVPRRTGTRDGGGPVGPGRRRRALPGRDRRLADLHPHPVRWTRARAVGNGRRRAAP